MNTALEDNWSIPADKIIAALTYTHFCFKFLPCRIKYKKARREKVVYKDK
jgi:hypothetical protein